MKTQYLVRAFMTISPTSVVFFAAMVRRRDWATAATGPGDSAVIEPKYFENLELLFNSGCSDKWRRMRASKSDLLPSVSTPNSPARACSSGFFLDLSVVDISIERGCGGIKGDVWLATWFFWRRTRGRFA